MSTTPIDHAARLHALCAPSSGDRWIACPGSVAMEADEPDSDSDASRDGTITHELINQWGVTGVCPPALLDDAERHERAVTHRHRALRALPLRNRERGNPEQLAELGLRQPQLRAHPADAVTGRPAFPLQFDRFSDFALRRGFAAARLL